MSSITLEPICQDNDVDKNGCAVSNHCWSRKYSNWMQNEDFFAEKLKLKFPNSNLKLEFRIYNSNLNVSITNWTSDFGISINKNYA